MKPCLDGSSTSRRLRGVAMLLAGCGALQAGRTAVWAGDPEITAVSSQASDDYARVKLADGSFQPETYTFGEGGHWVTSTRDDSIDKLNFIDLANVVAPLLAHRDYVPVPDRNPEKTKLLIMVYWGTTSGAVDAASSVEYQNLQSSQLSAPPPTQPPSASAGPHNLPPRSDFSAAMRTAREDDLEGAMASASLENSERDKSDMRNAALLGYDSELSATRGLELTAFHNRRDDLIAEIEENRYFVVLMAYDYQALWKHKKHGLLWVTRVSVRERGTDFGRVLPAMVKYASQYFGQDSHGLLRKELPEGSVEIGESKSLGVVPEK